jgi:hypothetical protein
MGGIPSTNMSLRSFLTPSSTSAACRDLDDALDWFRILLKERAVVAEDDEDMIEVSS